MALRGRGGTASHFPGMTGPPPGNSSWCRRLAGSSLCSQLVHGAADHPFSGTIFFSKQRVVSPDRKSTRLNSSHSQISYAVFCLKKKKKNYDAHVTGRLYRLV